MNVEFYKIHENREHCASGTKMRAPMTFCARMDFVPTMSWDLGSGIGMAPYNFNPKVEMFTFAWVPKTQPAVQIRPDFAQLA